jgi:hypothetical protein
VIVRCETCHCALDPENAHDFFDAEGDGQLHYWCSDDCPVCALSESIEDNQLQFPLEP